MAVGNSSGFGRGTSPDFDGVITCGNGFAVWSDAIPIKLYIAGARVPTFIRTLPLTLACI